MLFSAPLEVARTKAWTSAPRWHERVGQVRAHEAVRAGDEHGPAGVGLAELLGQLGERLLGPGDIGRGHRRVG